MTVTAFLASLPDLPPWLVQTGEMSKAAGVFLFGLALKSPLPENYFRGLLSKGALAMEPNAAVQTIFADLKVAAKVVASAIPGNNPDEKAAGAVAFLEPYFNEALAAQHVSPFLEKVADGLFELIVKAEVKAALA